jgi:hypothetical protein
VPRRPQDRRIRLQDQCGGSFIAHVEFVHNQDKISIFIPAPQITPFGDGHEPYEEPKVMACCGEWDRSVGFRDQPPVYVENCLLDFRQQACISIAAGLAAKINDGTVPIGFQAKAIEIQKYIAARTEECTLAMLPDMEDNPRLLQTSWQLPDDGPWAPQASNVQLVIDTAIIGNMFLPAEPATCTDLSDSNKFPFSPDPLPLPHIDDVTLDEGQAGLFGPDAITGKTAFMSLSTVCADPFCSTASFSTVDSTFAIDAMQLRMAGPMRVTHGQEVEVIDDARLELYGQALGDITGGGRAPLVHTIDAGKAQFLVVGEAAGESVTIPLLTNAPIVAHATGGVWSLEPFSLEFVDDSGNTWTIAVGATQWL